MAKRVKNSKNTEKHGASSEDADKDKPVRYKYCVVPGCRNSTHSTPNKLFLSMPRGEARSAWLAAMGRGPQHRKLSLTCNRFCCEDHFNLEEDMVNYLQWKLMGRSETKKLMLKKGVIPHKFDCQNESKLNLQLEESKKILEKSSEKCKRKQLKITKKNNNEKKRKKTGEDNFQDNKVEKNSPSLEEEIISEQRKKLKKITKFTQEAKEIPQENFEKYTFHIKIEAEDVIEEPINQTIQENLIQDPNTTVEESVSHVERDVFFDVNVKVEEIDEEFEPAVIQEETQEFNEIFEPKVIKGEIY